MTSQKEEIHIITNPQKSWETPLVREIHFGTAREDGYDGDDGSMGGFDS